MEQVNIPSQKIEMDSLELPCRKGITIVSWGLYEANALNLQKSSADYMKLEDISYLDANKKYSIYVTDCYMPTVDNNIAFVQRMLKESSFAKADKIMFVLYKRNLRYPFAVIVEEL